MTTWKYSVLMIIEAEHRVNGNILGAALGYGERNYSVALSPTGDGPPTHWAARTEATQHFIDILTGASQGVFPEIPSMTPEQVGFLMSKTTVDIKEHQDSPLEQFNEKIDEMGLNRE